MAPVITIAPETTLVKLSQQDGPEYEILRYISKFMRLSEAEAKIILDNMNYRLFKKGDILLREGQISNLCYFTLKGCVRQYYLGPNAFYPVSRTQY